MARKTTTRKTFPCDVRAQSDRQLKRLEKNEVPHADLTDLLGSVETSDFALDLPKLLAAAATIHPRAVSWVEAQMEGLTDRELAAEWGVTPQYVWHWKCTYENRIKALFVEFFDIRGLAA